MSTEVDNRVVSMQFDNSHFEKNVQTSVSTLEKLKQSLNLTGAAKGLENVNAAANGMNFGPLHRGVETVQAKFSALQVMAATALANITNSAVNAGKRIATSLTIEPIKTGFQEYETQIGAIQTILANTQSKGTTLQDVNGALDELNTYADKTIYNFTEMTRNIGTFTAAGVDLDKSVTSIKGIANLAAVSGSTSQQASTAMYQLSQALAAGRVSLMDWNSVVNAGMGGQVFQEALKRTATQMGTNVDALIKKYGSFRESLTQGEWLTADVLTETLTQLSGAYSEADLIAKGYSKKQAKEIAELAETAVSAATEVKTFTQLFDTMKESVQSGWTQTWEILVGDFGEAKEMLTKISEKFGELIGTSAEARNTLLSGTLSTGWKQLLNQGIDDAAGFEETVTKVAKKHGVDLSKMINDETTFQDTLKEGWLNSDILTESIQNFQKELSGMSQKEREAAGYTQETITKIEELASGVKKGTVSMEEFSELIARPSGRELLIESLWNSFDALMSVITPVKEAFRDIFPAPSAKQLYNLIEKFRDFTASLKLNDEQSKKLKTTFKGIFSVIDIGVTFIKEIVGGVVRLIGNFSGLGNSLLDNTSKMGDWLIGLRKSVKQSDIFGKAVDKVVDILSKAIEGIKKFVSAVKEKFIAPGFEGFLKVMTGLWKIIQTVAQKIFGIAGKIGEALGEAFRTGDLVAGLDVLNAALGTGILLGIKKFVGGIADQFDSGLGIIENIKKTFGAVQDSLSSLQDSLKAKTLQELAKAIAILAVSILVISLINPERLAASLGAITVLFADLLGASSVLGKTAGNFKTLVKATTIMEGVAIAVLIMAAALKIVSSIEPEKLAPGIVGIIILTGTIVKAAESMSKIKGKVIKGAGGLVIFAVAVKILASAVKDLSSLNFSELSTGLFGVGVLMAAVSIFLNKTDMKGKSAGTAVGILILAAAMKVLASATKDFASMNIEELAKGLGSVGILLFALSKFTNSTSGSKGMTSMGIGLVLIGAAMKILASAIKDLGAMDPKALGLGLSGMVVGLFAVVEIMKRMPPNMMASAISLVIVSSALVILSKALKSMGSMSGGEIAKSLIAMGLALTVLSASMESMDGNLAGMGAILGAAIALTILAAALKNIGSMSIGEIAKGLITITLAIAILGGAALLLTPVAPVMLTIAGAIALLGVGCLAAGVGIGMIAIGISLLATALATGATAIVAGLTVIITGLIALIPAVAAKIGEGIIVICQVLIAAVPVFCQAIVVITTAVLLALNAVIPLAVNVILNLLTKILESIANYLPRIVQVGIDIILAILKGIRDNIAEVVTVALEIVAEFINGIAEGLPDIIDAAFNLIISFIEGLADAIDKNTDRLISAVQKLMFALIRAAVKVLTGGIVDIKKIGEKIMKSGFVKGVKEKFSDAKKTVKELPGKLKTAILDKLSDLKNAGKDLMDGFINGIKDKMAEAGKAAAKVGKKALGSIKDVLGIASPAKELIKVGKFADLGLVKGLDKFSGKVATAAKSVGTVALDGVKGAMSRVSDLINSDVDSQPTIRPVLDLSDVEAGAGTINGLFGMTPSVGVMSNLGAISSMMSANQNGGNDDVVSAIKDLNKSIGNMSGNTYNVNGVTYDDGSNIANAVQAIARAATRERRI